MSAGLIALVGVAYAYVSGDSFYRVQVGMGIAYAGYALGSIGLYMLAKSSVQ